MRGKYFLGLILILLGIGLILDQFRVWSFGSLVADWWPLIIIIFGLMTVTKSRGTVISGFIIIILGTLLLANNLDMLPWGFWATLWPILLILGGVWILFSRKEFRRRGSFYSEDTINIEAFLSGNKVNVDSQNFKGGNVTAAFGGAEIDLTNARLSPEGAILDITVAFGGAEIRVPRDWKVQAQGFPFLGGVENKTRQDINNLSLAPSLKIKYTVALGGIEIKN